MFVFRNKGVIDKASIATFGVSVKTGENPIGFFGTGLKYAIAVLLRLGDEIVIYTDCEKITFTKVDTVIRGETFKLIHMNGLPMGFTTELGKTWEPWQALRELVCNTIDEGGEYFRATPEGTELALREPGNTAIAIKGRGLEEAWADLDSIILRYRSPFLDNQEIEVHHGASQWLYYRGVRASKLEKPSLFTYNILRKMELTEDRTIKYPWLMESLSRTIWGQAPENGVNEKALRSVLTAKGTFEETIQFTENYADPFFISIVTGLMREFAANLNKTASRCVMGKSFDDFVKNETQDLSKMDKMRLDKCVSFLKRLGYPIDKYPIIVTEYLGQDVWGRAEKGKIYLSKRVFMMGTKMLAGTLFEEWAHLEHNIYDETRQMQNFLIDAIMSVGEVANGELL